MLDSQGWTRFWGKDNSQSLLSPFTIHVIVNFDSRVDAFRIDGVNLTDSVTTAIQVCTFSRILEIITLSQQGQQQNAVNLHRKLKKTLKTNLNLGWATLCRACRPRCFVVKQNSRVAWSFEIDAQLVTLAYCDQSSKRNFFISLFYESMLWCCQCWSDLDISWWY